MFRIRAVMALGACALLAVVVSGGVAAEPDQKVSALSASEAVRYEDKGLSDLGDAIRQYEEKKQAELAAFYAAVAEQQRIEAEEAARQEAARQAALEEQRAEEAEAAASAPAPTQAPVAASGGCATNPDAGGCWDKLAQCESGSNWATNTGNGYYGGIQFSLSSWQGVGGTGYPHEHSRETQIEMGRRLWNQGGWAHWPACTAKFGWR